MKVTTEFSDKQLVFLTQYFRDPTNSINQYSKNTGISQITLKSYLDEFKNDGLLTSDKFISDKVLGMRVKSNVHALLQCGNLGLNKLTFVVSRVNQEYLEEIRLDMQKMPYFSRIIESQIPCQAFIIEYLVPVSMEGSFLNFFKFLKNLDYFDDFTCYVTKSTRRSSLNFQKLGYEFSENDIGDLRNEFSTKFISFTREEDKIAKQKFDDVDVSLLREIEINANLVLTSLEDSYEKDVSTLSRRLRSLRDQFVAGYRVDFDYKRLDMEKIIICGKASPKIIRVIRVMIQKQYFWFDSIFNSGTKSFIWEIIVPNDYFDLLKDFIDEFLEIDYIFLVDDVDAIPTINPADLSDSGKEWKLDEDILNQTIDRFMLSLVNEFKVIGEAVSREIEDKDLDIMSVMRQRFFDFRDFFDIIVQDPSPVLSSPELANLIKIETKADRYLYLALLYLYKGEMKDDQLQYLENMLLPPSFGISY